MVLVNSFLTLDKADRLKENKRCSHSRFLPGYGFRSFRQNSEVSQSCFVLQRCEKRQTRWNLTLFSGSFLPNLAVAYQVIWILSSNPSRTSWLFIHNLLSGVLLRYCCSKCSFLFVCGKKWGFLSFFFSHRKFQKFHFTIKMHFENLKPHAKCVYHSTPSSGERMKH